MLSRWFDWLRALSSSCSQPCCSGEISVDCWLAFSRFQYSSQSAWSVSRLSPASLPPFSAGSSAISSAPSWLFAAISETFCSLILSRFCSPNWGCHQRTFFLSARKRSCSPYSWVLSPDSFSYYSRALHYLKLNWMRYRISWCGSSSN